jgi:hypothetical protein
VNANKLSDNPELEPSLGTEQEFRWLRILVVAIIVLNILDAIFTLFWVNAGMAREANVLLRHLVHNHPVLFVIIKFTLVLAGTYVLWKYRYNKYAVLGMFGVFIIYYALLLHHLSYSSHIFFRTIFGI